jgi:signal transduction histidine kinase
MNIKKKLAVKFALIVASILLMFSLTVYFSSSQYRKYEFNSRLKDKAINTAKLLIDVDEVDNALLKIINKNTTALPDEKVIIYNYLNEEIYNSREEAGDSMPVPLLDQIRLEKELYYTAGETEVVAILYPGTYRRHLVIASATDKYGLSKLKNLRYVLILVFTVSVAITILAGWLFASKALEPIAKVVTDVNSISASNLHARLNEGNRQDEIANLSITFNKMLERLEAAFAMQKSFVANASHELRTPLTSVTSQIEVALLKKRSAEDYEKVLQSVLEDVGGLSKLYNGLLELAQIELENKRISSNPVRIDELLLASIEELTEAKNNYHICFEYDLLTEHEEKLTVVGSEALLRSAMTNIMDNACKFSNGSAATVRLGEEQGFLKITVADQGIGISQEALQHICEPFYRADNTLQIKGHGLGLSLTDKIIKLHKGFLQIKSTLDVGTTVTVLFPY